MDKCLLIEFNNQKSWVPHYSPYLSFENRIKITAHDVLGFIKRNASLFITLLSPVSVLFTYHRSVPVLFPAWC